MKKTAVDLLCWCVSLTGDNTEKIWVHRFLAKPKTIAIGGLAGAVSHPGGPG